MPSERWSPYVTSFTVPCTFGDREQAETRTMAGGGHPQQASPGLWEDAPAVRRDGMMPSPQPGCPGPGALWAGAGQAWYTERGDELQVSGRCFWILSLDLFSQDAWENSVLKSRKCFILLFRISTLLVSAVSSCPWLLQGGTAVLTQPRCWSTVYIWICSTGLEGRALTQLSVH